MLKFVLIGICCKGQHGLFFVPAQKQVSGRVTYNGHDMNEFVPQRSSAYISQYDVHIGEMTVRETLAFSARCQGVGTRYGKQYEVICHV